MRAGRRVAERQSAARAASDQTGSPLGDPVRIKLLELIEREQLTLMSGTVEKISPHRQLL
jgi:hypothetical protein